MAKHWYVVHVYAGAEKKVAQDIKAMAVKNALTELIEDIVVPASTSMEVRRGRKVTTEHRLMPGYILVRADMRDEVWHVIRNIPKVQGFLGSRLRPMPISEVEAQRFRQLALDTAETPVLAQHAAFEIGETVRVADGPFVSMVGVVDALDPENDRLKVSVMIFGRATPLDLDFTQVEKLGASV